MKVRINWDALGIATSALCAIHCAILPIIVSSLPFFGVNIVHNPLFEWGMIIFALLVGSYALVHGHVKHHRFFGPLILFLGGFTFLVLKQFYPALEYWFLFPAVVLIISAHYYNYRLCNRSKCSSVHHAH